VSILLGFVVVPVGEWCPICQEKFLVTSPKIELFKKTLDFSILEDNTKAFSRKPGH
jgi:hypothetical protein